MPRSLLAQPGFSSDTLDQPSRTLRRLEQEDQWSDAHDTVETDDERDVVEEIAQRQDELTIRPPKVSTTAESLKAHDMHTPSPTAPSPPSPPNAPSNETDAGSVRSLPVVQVTEPTSPTAMSSRSTNAAHPISPTSSLAPTTNSSLDRRATTHRATADTRASNRISGFFSSFIHRREHTPPAARESMTPSPGPTPTSAPRDSSRASSPLPSRAATPPPSLPPPSLSDLGLSLSSITSSLSPPHFSSPPCSGAFLEPHYLLLCHAQGLDVLPLVSPPAPHPYSLIRRVPFKSVVVMEHRGVLVAIAGRRDGVRVYALEEVKRAVEWRIDVEVKREREKTRREEMKKATNAHHEHRDKKVMDGRGMPPFPSSAKNKPDRRATVSAGSPSAPSPRTPQAKRPSTPPPLPTPSGPPPAYTPPNKVKSNLPVPVDSAAGRARTTSVNDVLAGTARRTHMTKDNDAQKDNKDDKDDWISSDDEAIDPMAAPSGSQALDERTSTAAPAPGSGLDVPTVPQAFTPATVVGRRRPANLDLSLTRANPPTNAIPTAAPPSPAPTLLSLQQALLGSPASGNSVASRGTARQTESQLEAEADDEEEAAPSSPTTPTRERISLAEALLESRIPEVPHTGAQRAQDAVLMNTTTTDDELLASPRTSESFSMQTRRSMGEQSTRRRRRWSVFDGIFQPGASLPSPSVPVVPERLHPSPADRSLTTSQPEMRQRQPSVLSRSQSTREASAMLQSMYEDPRPSSAPTHDNNSRTSVTQSPSSTPVSPQPASASVPRFLPRIITNAFNPRRSEDQQGSPRTLEFDGRRSLGAQAAAQAPAPKLEYVKLPGTKGSIMVKAVETAKKSFLAILCGENGEKVELFAGTYRTALGLSRTFILPDSPRSLELQLQGDDLVEVFLVFSQNVFGLEPATVRVREVRIGRAERRAARRRLRETQQTTDAPDADAPGGEDDTAVNVTIGVAVAPASSSAADEVNHPSPLASPLPGSMHPADTPTNQSESGHAVMSAVNADELLTLATAQTSPYTTFQQLTFAPNFPLASIADDYVIPPTYPSFLDYRARFEPEDADRYVDLSQVQFSPPGLPVPPAVPPSNWCYRDPKGVVHGPWPASLMQQWYKDALLPPDLPVRREEETEYVLLRELRLQCVDPTHPFRTSPPPPSAQPVFSAPLVDSVDPSKPLLQPISILSQPKHFGPPPLFFSSRGGHSTTIVDARGRSVLKGRFIWSPDDGDDNEVMSSVSRLGDVKRLEAFDVQDRAVLVAVRQGGLEAVDFGDALLLPADHSRTTFPHFHPPNASVNRRNPFVWRIGTPTSPTSSSPPLPSLPPKLSHRFHSKKQSAGQAKSPGRNDFSLSGDPDSEHPYDEIFFLGRKGNEVYMCERRYGSFRILCITPSSAA